MNYNKFLINVIKNKDTKSLNKYNTLTEKLANKDIKFNKYLLKNNITIKQYGGGMEKDNWYEIQASDKIKKLTGKTRKYFRSFHKK